MLSISLSKLKWSFRGNYMFNMKFKFCTMLFEAVWVYMQLSLVCIGLDAKMIVKILYIFQQLYQTFLDFDIRYYTLETIKVWSVWCFKGTTGLCRWCYVASLFALKTVKNILFILPYWFVFVCGIRILLGFFFLMRHQIWVTFLFVDVMYIKVWSNICGWVKISYFAWFLIDYKFALFDLYNI